WSRGWATAPAHWRATPWRSRRRRAVNDPAARRHHLRRGDMDPGRQVNRDLRGDLRDRADADGAGAEAPRPLPGALRAQPRWAVRPSPAAGGRAQADQQGALPSARGDP